MLHDIYRIFVVLPYYIQHRRGLGLRCGVLSPYYVDRSHASPSSSLHGHSHPPSVQPCARSLGAGCARIMETSRLHADIGILCRAAIFLKQRRYAGVCSISHSQAGEACPLPLHQDAFGVRPPQIPPLTPTPRPAPVNPNTAPHLHHPHDPPAIPCHSLVNCGVSSSHVCTPAAFYTCLCSLTSSLRLRRCPL